MSAGEGPGKLKRLAEAAIAALLTEPTHADAAAKAGISEATLQRWLRKPKFVAAYRLARRAVLVSAIGRLQRATGKAVTTLERNLDCGEPGPEIRAAVAVLDQAARGLESLDMMDRLAELERLVDDVTGERQADGTDEDDDHDEPGGEATGQAADGGEGSGGVPPAVGPDDMQGEDAGRGGRPGGEGTAAG